MSNWQPNEKQKLVLGVLEKSEKPLTLAEISKELGQEIKTGTTNTLITKHLISGEVVDIACNIVAVETGEVVGHMTKHVNAYSLVKGE